MPVRSVTLTIGPSDEVNFVCDAVTTLTGFTPNTNVVVDYDLFSRGELVEEFDRTISIDGSGSGSLTIGIGSNPDFSYQATADGLSSAVVRAAC